jgi:hypothetical protein
MLMLPQEDRGLELIFFSRPFAFSCAPRRSRSPSASSALRALAASGATCSQPLSATAQAQFQRRFDRALMGRLRPPRCGFAGMVGATVKGHCERPLVKGLSDHGRSPPVGLDLLDARLHLSRPILQRWLHHKRRTRPEPREGFSSRGADEAMPSGSAGLAAGAPTNSAR